MRATYRRVKREGFFCIFRRRWCTPRNPPRRRRPRLERELPDALSLLLLLLRLLSPRRDRRMARKVRNISRLIAF